MEEMVVKVGPAETEREPVREDLKDVKNTATPLKQKIDELKRLVQKTQEENETLQKWVEKMKDDVFRQIEAAKKGQRENERQLFNCEGRIRELEKRIAGLEEKPAIAVEREQKIGERGLRPEKKLINNPKQAAMTKVASGDSTGENENIAQTQSAFARSASDATAQPLYSDILKFRKLEIISVNANNPRSVRPGQTFGIRLIIDLDEEKLLSATPLYYKATIYAMSLNGNLRDILVEAHNLIQPSKTLVIDAVAKALSAGAYRLQALVALQPPEGEVGACASPLMEGGLIHVC